MFIGHMKLESGSLPDLLVLKHPVEVLARKKILPVSGASESEIHSQSCSSINAAKGGAFLHALGFSKVSTK